MNKHNGYLAFSLRPYCFFSLRKANFAPLKRDKTQRKKSWTKSAKNNAKRALFLLLSSLFVCPKNYKGHNYDTSRDAVVRILAKQLLTSTERSNKKHISQTSIIRVRWNDDKHWRFVINTESIRMEDCCGGIYI